MRRMEQDVQDYYYNWAHFMIAAKERKFEEQLLEERHRRDAEREQERDRDLQLRAITDDTERKARLLEVDHQRAKQHTEEATKMLEQIKERERQLDSAVQWQHQKEQECREKEQLLRTKQMEAERAIEQRLRKREMELEAEFEKRRQAFEAELEARRHELDRSQADRIAQREAAFEEAIAGRLLNLQSKEDVARNRDAKYAEMRHHLESRAALSASTPPRDSVSRLHTPLERSTVHINHEAPVPAGMGLPTPGITHTVTTIEAVKPPSASGLPTPEGSPGLVVFDVGTTRFVPTAGLPVTTPAHPATQLGLFASRFDRERDPGYTYAEDPRRTAWGTGSLRELERDPRESGVHQLVVTPYADILRPPSPGRARRASSPGKLHTTSPKRSGSTRWNKYF